MQPRQGPIGLRVTRPMVASAIIALMIPSPTEGGVDETDEGVRRTLLPGRRARSEDDAAGGARRDGGRRDRKSTRLNSSHGYISYAVFCLKKKKAGHRPTVRSGFCCRVHTTSVTPCPGLGDH